ncbi:MAG: HAMP domain-containing sensor histidine kinase [Thermoactinomyces sp.]
MKRGGIFAKVFVFTTMFSVLLVCVTAAFFSVQIVSYYKTQSIRKINRAYQHIVIRAQEGKDIIETAKWFHERNRSLQFAIRDKGGNVIYATPDTDLLVDGHIPPLKVYSGNDYEILVPGEAVAFNYDSLILRVVAALSAIIAASIAGSFFFARQLTKPIKTLAYNTNRMANLEDVPPPPERKDELGMLARDVHSMYEKLKETISRLEDEILRERELEETQRYFFSAASHELKTPIAAARVLLEGMIANVGDYKDHPKYLRECVKLMDAQSKTISEILEIVNLNDGKIKPIPEKLDLGQIVADILPDFETLAKANDLRIVTDIPNGQTCYADPKMLSKALSNIILNSVQNTPKGGEIRIWCCESMMDKYRLSVLNTGVRIDDAVLPKLFDPFYRADKARSRKSGRSGLGLTIVQKTLKAMDIAFALENTPEGVLFWMDLPKA